MAQWVGTLNVLQTTQVQFLAPTRQLTTYVTPDLDDVTLSSDSVGTAYT